jgi:serine/threonine protein kinase
VWLALACGASAFASPLEITSCGRPTDLAGAWKFHVGDDPAWAQPAYDDSQWERIVVPETWGRQGHAGYGGVAWYRLELHLSPQAVASARDVPPGVSFGSCGFGAYEAYAGGRRIGGVGAVSPPQAVISRPAAYPIAADAIEPDGRLVLAVRVWADPGIARTYPATGGFGEAKYLQARFLEGKFLFGSHAVVREATDAIYLKLVRDSLPLLLAAALCAATGLHQIQMFRRRRAFAGYFWFAVLALGYAVNLACASPLSDEASGGAAWSYRLGVATTNVMFVTLIQFLWTFLSGRIGWFLRAYQIANLPIMIFVLFGPLHLVIGSIRERFLWLAVTLAASLVFVTMKAIQGNREARVIWFGVMCLIAASLERFVHQTLGLGGWSLVTSLNLLAGGYASLVGLMAISVSQRFRRTYDDLESLNRNLERRVAERTEELNQKNVDLAENVRRLKDARQDAERKNQELDRKVQELIASRQQADRIFSALAEALPGTTLDGKYRLDEKIGAGGFGAVFKATHLALNAPVAVKVFKPSPGNDSVDAVERFKREGVSASRLTHPNAIRILDSGISVEGVAYLVMELLVGRTLYKEMQQFGRLSLSRVAEVMVPVCEALNEAHCLGVVHRDVKPDNIFLNEAPDGEVVKVVDFGIAKFVHDDHGDDERLTATGVVVGTPAYMSPERLRGEAYDGKSDVYSLGVMAYEMLCGRLPFQSAGGQVSAILAHLSQTPAPLRAVAPELPEAVETTVLQMLEKDPTRRPTAGETAEFFAQFAPPPRKRQSGALSGRLRPAFLSPTPTLVIGEADSEALTQADIPRPANVSDETVAAPAYGADGRQTRVFHGSPTVEDAPPDHSVQETSRLLRKVRENDIGAGPLDGRQ